MKNKNLIIGIVAAVVIIAMIFVVRSPAAKKPVKKPALPAGKITAQIPVKKAITKNKGVLTVKILDSKKRELSVKLRAFKAIDSRTSVYESSLVANKAQELNPGTYDLEMDTTPQRIYKDVKVAMGRENVADLGTITGSVNVKALNAQKKDASYPIKILHDNSNVIAANGTTNKPVEIMPGDYKIEIGTAPKMAKSNIKVTAGKEVSVDLGCPTGTLFVKAVDENNKEARYGVRITRSDNNELVSSQTTNKPIEVLEGVYNIEVASTPKQDRKEVKVGAGEAVAVEFLVQAPPPPVPVKAIPPAARKAKK